MTTDLDALAAMRARDRAFGDGESEDASESTQDRHALLDRCEALQAALSEALSALEASHYPGPARRADLATVARLRAIAAGGAPAPAVAADAEQSCPGSRGW